MSPIEKFHQERSDQDITGRVINGRKIMVKTRVRTSPLVIISSGQNSPSTNPNSPQPMSNHNNASPNNIDRLQGGRPPLSERLGTTLSDRFSDSNRREDRYDIARGLVLSTTQLSNSTFRKLKLMNPYLRKAKFFLVRSVFEENIEIAQDKSVWATLPHNEKKFNHAFSVRRYFLFSRKRLLQVFTKILSFRLSKMYFCFLL